MMRRLLLPLLFAIMFCAAALADSAPELIIPQGMQSFGSNTITVNSPMDGTCVLEVSSGGTVIARLEEQPVTVGNNSIAWNGLGFDGEVLPKASYTMTALLTTADGESVSVSKDFSMARPKNALWYALPSSDTFYQGSASEWGIQLETSSAGKVVMAFYAEETPELCAAKVILTSKKGPTNCRWNGKADGQKLKAGVYRVVCYLKDNEEYSHEFTLTIQKGKAPEQEVGVTGAIIPSRNATDEEIWQMMTAPAVVFDNEEGSGNPVYEQAKTGSKVLGYLHGKGTAVEVIRITEDGKWAYIGAWAASRAYYIEGYVPVSKLKVVTPAQDYGLLVDKQTQTLTLFDHGVRAAVMKVSTGKPISHATLKRETEAGSYLTVTRIGSFGQEGYRYEYPIRYNCSQLLHSVGWNLVDKQHSFVEQNARLGTRDSHGCVRLERTTEGGVNAWWMWTHLRWNTRIIIMDNPEERAADYAAYCSDWADMPYTGAGTNGWD